MGGGEGSLVGCGGTVGGLVMAGGLEVGGGGTMLLGILDPPPPPPTAPPAVVLGGDGTPDVVGVMEDMEDVCL
jgi:hypothetical protein